jgi:hypothetical protein
VLIRRALFAYNRRIVKGIRMSDMNGAAVGPALIPGAIGIHLASHAGPAGLPGPAPTPGGPGAGAASGAGGGAALPFVLLSDSGTSSRVFLGCVAAVGGTVVKPLALKLQRALPLDAAASAAGAAAGLAGSATRSATAVDSASAEAAFRRELAAYAKLAGRGVTPEFVALNEPGAEPDPVPPMIYCRHRRVLFRPRDPVSMETLTDCRDDAMLAAHGLPTWTGSARRYLYAPKRCENGDVRFYTDRPDGPFTDRVVPASRLYVDWWHIIAKRAELEAARHPMHGKLIKTFPCYECPFNAECYPGPNAPGEAVRRLTELSFSEFHLLAMERMGLTFDGLTDLISGRPPADPADPPPARLFSSDDDGLDVLEIFALKLAAFLEACRAVAEFHRVTHTPHLNLAPRHLLAEIPTASAAFGRTGVAKGPSVGLATSPTGFAVFGAGGAGGPSSRLGGTGTAAPAGGGNGAKTGGNGGSGAGGGGAAGNPDSSGSIPLPSARLPSLWNLRVRLIDPAAARPLVLPDTPMLFAPPARKDTDFAHPMVASDVFGRLERGNLTVLSVRTVEGADPTSPAAPVVVTGVLEGEHFRPGRLGPKDRVELMLISLDGKVTGLMCRPLSAAEISRLPGGGAVPQNGYAAHGGPGAGGAAPAGGIHVESRPTVLPQEIRASLEAAAGKPLNGLRCALLPSLNVPCDVHSLGLIWLRSLLVNARQDWPAVRVAVEGVQTALAEAFARRPADRPGVMAWLAGHLEKSPAAGMLLARNLTHEADDRPSAVPPSYWVEALTIGLSMIMPGRPFSVCKDHNDYDESDPGGKVDSVVAQLDSLYRRVHALLFHRRVRNSEVCAAIDELLPSASATGGGLPAAADLVSRLARCVEKLEQEHPN